MRYLLVCLICTMSAYPVQASSPCEPSGIRPYVDFTVDPGQPRYHTNKNKGQLTKLQRQTMGQPSAGWLPIGLTLTERGLQFGLTMRQQQLSDHSYCSEVASVQASLLYHRIDVYIAREYPRGSCQYNSIVDHERRHVGIYHDTLAEFAPRIENTFYDVLGKMKPVHNNDPERALQHYMEKLERATAPLFDELDRVASSRNASMDTPENYRKEQQYCLSW